MNIFALSATSPTTAPQRPSSKVAGKLYFAYGSNLHISQMATRCPGSIFKGKATLCDYRWQINERGVANVVETAQGSSVEGLVFLVNAKDERSLDRSEGVAKGLYQKHFLEVNFERHERYFDYKSPALAQLLAQQGSSDEWFGSKSQLISVDPRESDPGSLVGPGAYTSNDGRGGGQERVKVLVYVSENYRADGVIRKEYIGRMQDAISDAVTLGVSRVFVDNYIVPSLDRSNVIPVTAHAANQQGRSDDGTALGEPRTHVGEHQAHQRHSNSSPFNPVDLGGLKQENRGPHSGFGAGFSPQMLSEMAATIPGSPGNGNKIYLVAVKEYTAPSNFNLSIVATTLDLELANELAMKSFRDAYSQRLKPSALILGRWFQSNSDDAQPGDLLWRLESNGCLHLSIATPQNENQVTVSVEEKMISSRI